MGRNLTNEIHTSALNVALRDSKSQFFSFQTASLHCVLTLIWWSHMRLMFSDFRNGPDTKQKLGCTSCPTLEDIADWIVKVFDEVR